MFRPWLSWRLGGWMLAYCSAETAARENLFSGEPCGVVRGQKDGDRSDIADLPDAGQRGLTDNVFLEVRSEDSEAENAFGHDHAGIQRVNPNLPRPELARKHAGDGVNRALCAGVDRSVRRGGSAGDRTYIDYAAAFAEMLDRRLCGEQKAEHIDVEHPVKLIF